MPGGEQGLAGDAVVGGAGGDHDDPAADGVGRLGRPGQQAAVVGVGGVGQLREHRGGVRGGGPGEQRGRARASRRAAAISPTCSGVLPGQ